MSKTEIVIGVVLASAFSLNVGWAVHLAQAGEPAGPTAGTAAFIAAILAIMLADR